jgi:hypothetical protein
MDVATIRRLAMKRRISRRMIPSVTYLESRRLLSETVVSIQQDNADYVGQTNAAYDPNDYQDIDISVSNLPVGVTGPDGNNTKKIDFVDVQAPGDEWTLDGTAWPLDGTGWHNAAHLEQNYSTHTAHIYVDPSVGAKNYDYEHLSTTFYIRLYYHDNPSQSVQISYTLYDPLNDPSKRIDPNKRVIGKELSAQWIGQDPQNKQDWAGPSAAVGPDGIQDFQLKLSNISHDGIYQSLLLISNPGSASALAWEAGTNSYYQWPTEQPTKLSVSYAEDLHRAIAANGLDTLDVFANPTTNQNSNASLTVGASLFVRIVYIDNKRKGKSDIVAIAAGLTAGSINPSLAMSYAPLPSFASATAHSQQISPSIGTSSIVLDSLPSGQSSTSIKQAVLSDQVGGVWVYSANSTQPQTYASDFFDEQQRYGMPLTYNQAGTFSFPAYRNEIDSTLTLRLIFNNGSQAIARVAGLTSDPNQRALPVGAGTVFAANEADLYTDVATSQTIQLAANKTDNWR